jgi:hypothetical protein
MASHDATADSASHVVFRKGSLTDLTSRDSRRAKSLSFAQLYCSGDCHSPYLRADEWEPAKVPFTPRGCVLLVQLSPNCQKAPIPCRQHRLVGELSHEVVPDFGAEVWMIAQEIILFP